ncbi:serine protease gd isoform X2 [Nomia melanderi]|uniref:serine protease gd isoform X2 n=2 Tax=Nomia melanderi TaxID=2448451 RepID=UPI003FCCBCBF
MFTFGEVKPSTRCKYSVNRVARINRGHGMSFRMFAPVVLLLLSPLQLFIATAESATCIPNYFNYVNVGGNVYIGRIDIPSPPKDIPLQLSVTLSIASVLPTAYVGRLELTESRTESVKAIQRGGPLKYTIHFPLPHQVPNVNEIRFNGQQICSDRRATGQVITSIVLNHTLFPPSTSLLTVDDRSLFLDLQSLDDTTSEPDIRPPTVVTNTPATFTPSPPVPTIPSVPTIPPSPLIPSIDLLSGQCILPAISNQLHFSTQTQCGRRSNFIGLVAGGQVTKRGEWPWLAALFVVLNQYKFQCAGSLITHTHVITAAHCMWYFDVKLPVGALSVFLGRYYLEDFREEGSVPRKILSISIHPDYLSQKSTGLTTADADVAILKLQERVEYNQLIQPVCLWAGCRDLFKIIGKRGSVVGWGRDEQGHQTTQEPRVVEVPIVSTLECHWSYRPFAEVTSNRTFCAGFRNSTGPCNGDSGSGLVIYDKTRGRYYLRGIVSLSASDRSSNSCDLNKYVIYTDVAMHLEWIYQQIST